MTRYRFLLPAEEEYPWAPSRRQADPFLCRLQPLTMARPIDRRTIADWTLLFIGREPLTASFDIAVADGLVKHRTTRKPWRMVFRDAKLASDCDTAKISVEQRVKLLPMVNSIRTL